MLVCVQVRGLKQLGYHAGHQEVSMCCTRGESEESVAQRRWSTQVRDPPGVWVWGGRCVLGVCAKERGVCDEGYMSKEVCEQGGVRPWPRGTPRPRVRHTPCGQKEWHTPVTLWTEWLTDRGKNITFPQLRLRPVKNASAKYLSFHLTLLTEKVDAVKWTLPPCNHSDVHVHIIIVPAPLHSLQILIYWYSGASREVLVEVRNKVSTFKYKKLLEKSVISQSKVRCSSSLWDDVWFIRLKIFP